MPAFQKAQKYVALSAFALCTTFHAATLRAATTTATAVTTASTSADTAATADAPAQDAATPAAAAPAPAAAPTWSVGPIDFSGLVDGYYSFNANHPSPATNQLRNFDFDANSFSLNMIKLSMAHSPDPVGFQVDLGFGKAFSNFGLGVTSCIGTSTGVCDSGNDIHLEQAYVAWKPTKGKGFEADFGEFVTSAGAEVIETMNNPNYSRSLLFVQMLPYYHMGLRTSMPVTKADTFGVQIVNGWNNVSDNNSGKTFGLTNVYTKAKYAWYLNYYVGPENSNTSKGFRNLIDTTLTLTPTAKLSGYLNYDYLQNRNAAINPDGTYSTTNLIHQQGIAAEARYQATGTVAFSGRYEYLADESGAITQGQIGGSAIKAGLNEFTITGEYKMAAGLLARLEYRRDGADNAIFHKGANYATSNLVKGQSTVEFGVVAFFGPKR